MHILTFFISSFCIVIAGMILARTADVIAEKSGLGRIIVGSLLLAGAASMTELFVGFNAVKNNDTQLAAGNLIGACLINLIILAIADILHKGTPSNKFSKASASHALVGSISIVLMIITVMSIFLENYIGGASFLRAGIGSWAILITFALTLKINFKNQQFLEKQRCRKSPKRINFKGLGPCFLIFGICAAVLAISSPYLVSSAEIIAQQTGIETSFIGLTLIALTTSLPELVSTIQSVRMGAYELALGSIIGSNIYNIILIALLDFMTKDSVYSYVPNLLIFSCLGIILATSVAIIGQLYQVERNKRLVEPDAAAILGIVLMSLFITYKLS